MNNSCNMQHEGNMGEPYIGMPICLGGCIDINNGNVGNNGSGGNNGNNGNVSGGGAIDMMCSCLNDLPLAMAYVPMQKWDSVYEMGDGFYAGTIFPALNLPFTGGRRR